MAISSPLIRMAPAVRLPALSDQMTPIETTTTSKSTITMAANLVREGFDLAGDGTFNESE
jgi:diacylglycerol kinase family enzyme